MRRTLLALLLAAASFGQTTAVPLRSLLESGKGNAGSVRFDRDSFMVAKRTSDGTILTLGVVQLGAAVAGRVNRVGVLATREYLTPSERVAFNQAAISVALKCFNLRAERKAAIVAWLDQQNASVFRNVNTDFGPMNLQFMRALDDDGQYTTWVRFSRSGMSGVAPWVNYCTP